MRRVIVAAILGVGACSAWAGSERAQTPTLTGQDPKTVPSRPTKPGADTSPLPQTGAVRPTPVPRGDAAERATPPVVNGTGTAIPTLQHADLVVLGPEVSEVVHVGSNPDVAFYQYAHAWTVQNQGNAIAHSTQLVLNCEDNHKEYGDTACAGGAQSWNKTLDLPPLGPGASFHVESSDYGKPIVTAIKKIKPAGNPDAPAEFVKHWLKFTATVDPGQVVDEIVTQNNTVELVMANMPETGKLASIMSKGAKADALPVAVLPKPATVEPGAGPLKVAPKYTITTEDPWSPGFTNWVLVFNSGNSAAVEASVGVRCENISHIEYNQTVDEWNAALPKKPGMSKLKKKKLAEHCNFLPDQQLKVPPLAKGAMHPLIQLSTAPLAEGDYTITFTGPAGDKLVLSTKPPQFKAGAKLP
jgi:hypothetical protein